MPPFPELKDITPPAPPPFSSPEEVQALVLGGFGVTAGIILMVAAWLWWRWRARRAKPPPLPLPALEHLRSRLAALQPQAATLPPAALGQQVGDAVRTYLQREHGLMARYRTTEELFGITRGQRRLDAPPPLPFLLPFADVFDRCDALKFAGTDADAAQRTHLLERALAAIDEVRAALAPRPVPVTIPPAAPPPTALATPLADGLATPAADPGAVAPSPSPTRAATLAPPVSPTFHSAPSLVVPLRLAVCPRSDAFAHPQTAAFARGADVIPT